MKRLMQDLSAFAKCKAYVAVLGLTAACSYGFAVTHPSIGMDDTAIPLYFEDGVAPYVGRWCLFVMNKLFCIDLGSFAPWMTELLSVFIFMLSVTLWCVLWRRICGSRNGFPVWKYLFVAGIFISCPLISEVFIFYLHNGICTGYGVTALALLCLLESLSADNEKRKQLKSLLLSAALLTVAIGFYESFALAYVMGGGSAYFLLRRLYGKEGRECVYSVNTVTWLRNGFFAVSGSILMRTVILFVTRLLYDQRSLERYDVLYRHLFGNNFRVAGELVMNVKRFYVMYYVNAVVYLPITVLVLSLGAVFLYGLWHALRKKDIMLFVCGAALIVLPVLMSIVEGTPTHYRSAQYVPVVGGYTVLLLLLELEKRKARRWLNRICFLLLSILIYDQCADMNKWFYVDYMKYRDMVAVMDQVAYDLEMEYDISKPVVLTGGYRVPYEIAKDAYCSFSSPQYRWICRLTDPLDPYLKGKYHAENGRGYIFAEAPIVSPLQWGVTAFDGTCGQLIEFWRMHGHSFAHVADPEVCREADRIRRETNMPGYPQRGYIREEENYIIVNLESR